MQSFCGRQQEAKPKRYSRYFVRQTKRVIDPFCDSSRNITACVCSVTSQGSQLSVGVRGAEERCPAPSFQGVGAGISNQWDKLSGWVCRLQTHSIRWEEDKNEWIIWWFLSWTSCRVPFHGFQLFIFSEFSALWGHFWSLFWFWSCSESRSQPSSPSFREIEKKFVTPYYELSVGT